MRVHAGRGPRSRTRALLLSANRSSEASMRPGRSPNRLPDRVSWCSFPLSATSLTMMLPAQAGDRRATRAQNVARYGVAVELRKQGRTAVSPPSRTTTRARKGTDTRPQPDLTGPGRTHNTAPDPHSPRSEAVLRWCCDGSPDRIRTGATALRGRRRSPTHRPADLRLCRQPVCARPGRGHALGTMPAQRRRSGGLHVGNVRW